MAPRPTRWCQRSPEKRCADNSLWRRLSSRHHCFILPYAAPPTSVPLSLSSPFPPLPLCRQPRTEKRPKRRRIDAAPSAFGDRFSYARLGSSAVVHRSRSPIAASNSAAIWRASRRSKQALSSARSSSICCSIDILASSILRKMKASPGVEWAGSRTAKRPRQRRWGCRFCWRRRGAKRSGVANKIGGTIVLEAGRSAPVSWAGLSGFSLSWATLRRRIGAYPCPSTPLTVIAASPFACWPS